MIKRHCDLPSLQFLRARQHSLPTHQPYLPSDSFAATNSTTMCQRVIAKHECGHQVGSVRFFRTMLKTAQTLLLPINAIQQAGF